MPVGSFLINIIEIVEKKYELSLRAVEHRNPQSCKKKLYNISRFCKAQTRTIVTE